MTVSGVSFVGIYDYCRQDLGQWQAHDFPKEGVPTRFFGQNFGENPLNLKNTPQILALGGALHGVSTQCEKAFYQVTKTTVKVKPLLELNHVVFYRCMLPRKQDEDQSDERVEHRRRSWRRSSQNYRTRIAERTEGLFEVRYLGYVGGENRRYVTRRWRSCC